MNFLARLLEQHRGKLWLGQAIALLGIGVVVGMSLGGHSMPDGSAAPDPHAEHQTTSQDAPSLDLLDASTDPP